MINLSALQHTHTERDNIFKAFPSRHFWVFVWLGNRTDGQ
jgi:hypothetical protein